MVIFYYATSDRELKEAGEISGLIVMNPEEGESVL